MQAFYINILIDLLFMLPLLIMLFLFRRRNLSDNASLQHVVSHISENVKVLTNHYSNNIRSVLLKVLYEELSDLGNNKRVERALWGYFKNKVSDVVDAYYELKNGGLEKVKEAGFASQLLGSGSVELILQNPYFPKEFTEKVDGLNQCNYEEFKEALFIELNLNTSDDKIAIVKTVSVELFRKNVKAIYGIFKDTRHLAVNGEENTGHCQFPKIDKNIIREMVASGDYGMRNAIELIVQNPSINEETRIELAVLSARLNKFMKKERTGTDNDETEINRIRISLLSTVQEL